MLGGLFFVCISARIARAETVQAAIGSKALSLSDGRVVCAPPGGGWSVEPASQGHALRPPFSADAIGKAVTVKVARTLAACSNETSELDLVATAHAPSVEPGGVILQPDQQKVEVRGHRLAGVAIAWRNNTASGVDVCDSPKLDGNVEHCVFDVGRGLSADPSSGSLILLPAGARAGSDVQSYDLDGDLVPRERLALVPSRVVLSSIVAADASIDLSTGRGEVELTHLTC